MYRVFNMGIGLIVVASQNTVDGVMARIDALGERGFVIGEIVAAKGGESEVEYVD
jgi:phosphoribosylformylglycinamidine cyclo-ligase